MSTEVIDLPIKSLWVSDINVRKDPGDVTELAKSIGEQGLFQPLLVRQESDGRSDGNPIDGAMFGIIIGSRRFAAAKKAKVKQIPVIVKALDDDEALIVSLADNLQRNDLEPNETVNAIDRALERHTQVDLADKLGKSEGYVGSMHGISSILRKLEQFGTKVKSHPSDEMRERGKEVPVFHTIQLATVFRVPVVAKVLENEPNKDIEIVQKSAKNTSIEIIKIAKQIKLTPNLPVETIIEKALESKGGSSGGGSSGTSEGHVDSETKLWHNKLMWNLERNTTKYDFYTIGYSGTDIDLFIERLKSKNVKTLIDVRKNAFSLYKQDFNGQNLSLLLNDCDIGYFHQPEWGIDRELREELDTLEDYQKLWKWYDKNVLGKDLTTSGGLPWNFDQPWAFMCSELDPTKCHRHRIARHLEKEFNMKSMDL